METPEPSGRGRHFLDGLILACILAAGIALRISYLTELTHDPSFSHHVDDMEYHDYWAKGLVTGDWTPPKGYPDPLIPSSPYMKHPGYSYFLAALYLATNTNYLAVRLIQMALGLLSAVLAFGLGRFLYGRAAGFVTGAFMSTYWIFIYYEGELLAVTLEVFLCLLLLCVLLIGLRRVTWKLAFLTGILFGITVLVRTSVGIFAGPILVWYAWMLYRQRGNEASRKRGFEAVRLRGIFSSLPHSLASSKPHSLVASFLGVTAAFVIGFIMPIVPVTARNYIASKEFVLIDYYTFGFNLYYANNEYANGLYPLGKIFEEVEGTQNLTLFDIPSVIRGIGRKLGKEHIGYAEGSKYLEKMALEYIRRNPGITLKRVAQKAYFFWCPKEIDSNKPVSYDKKHFQTLRYLPGFPLVLTVFVLGLLNFFADFWRKCRAGALTFHEKDVFGFSGLMLSFIITYYLAFVPFPVVGRYRVTIFPFLFLFGGYGLFRLAQFTLARDLRRTVFWGLLTVGLYALASIQFIPYESNELRWYMQRAEMYANAEDWPHVIEEYRAALRIAEQDIVHDNLGALLAAQGNFDEAIEHFAAALRLNPGYSNAQYHWAQALASQGKWQEAASRYREVIRQNPASIEAHNGLGMALFNLGQPGAAIAEYQQAIKLNPGAPQPYNNLGNVLADQKRFEEAIENYRKAIKIDPRSTKTYLHLANTLAMSGRTDEAVTQYLEIIQKDPANQDALFNLGAIMDVLGRFDEAVRYYDKLLALDPSDNTARARREQAAAKISPEKEFDPPMNADKHR